MKDFWTFTKESLEADNSIINKILKEQATLLTKKTSGVLQGKVSNRVISSINDEKILETAFEVTVPNLEDYITSLFYVYSKPEANFPAYITFHRVPESMIKKEEIGFILDYCRALCIFCENEIDEVIGKVFSSSDVNNTITVLYQKAK